MKNKFAVLFLGLILGITGLLCIADTPLYAPGNSTLSFQEGSNVTVNVYLSTNTFNPPFSAGPQVFVTPVGANSPTNYIVSVNATNFVVQLSATNQIYSWLAIGPR